MKAVPLARTRVLYTETAFAELVLWQVPSPVPGSAHSFKYRLAYVVDGLCVLRYDNEAGKGDHFHRGEQEFSYAFSTADQLLADFQEAIAQWNRDNEVGT